MAWFIYLLKCLFISQLISLCVCQLKYNLKYHPPSRMFPNDFKLTLIPIKDFNATANEIASSIRSKGKTGVDIGRYFYFNQMFTMDIMFGRQKEIFRIMPDTSTSWIWVTSVECIDNPKMIGDESYSQCGYAENKFDGNTSNSFTKLNDTAIWKNSFHSYEYNMDCTDCPQKTHNRLASGILANDYIGYDAIIDRLIKHDFIYANLSENLGDFQADGSLGLNSLANNSDYKISCFTENLYRIRLCPAPFV